MSIIKQANAKKKTHPKTLPWDREEIAKTFFPKDLIKPTCEAIPNLQVKSCYRHPSRLPVQLCPWEHDPPSLMMTVLSPHHKPVHR